MPITPIIPAYSVCTPWCTTDDFEEPCATLNLNLTLAAECCTAASDILFHLSGSQFAGSCQDVIRPEPRLLVEDRGRPIRPYYPAWGYGYSGSWGGPAYGMVVGNRMRSGCYLLPAITLGVYPLTGIEQVKIDGVVQDPATYFIANNKWLVRRPDPLTGQNNGWPTCQRMDLDDSHVGTWSVTFDFGTPPPPLGKEAAAELACQLALAMTPSAAGSCRLPQRVVSITRQGVSAVVSDPMTFLDKGMTGLRICDMFIESVNPGRIRRRASVASPDISKRSFRWTA